jgi:17beta-estradiol 17-dehydrogenase / very-long-chain 3-oxoacyl-CoA reductase
MFYDRHVMYIYNVQVPMLVATKMASIKTSSFFVPSPDTYAHAAIRYIGYEPRCTPYWTHALLWLLFSLVPEPVADKMILNIALDVRTKGRDKDAKRKTHSQQ